MHRRTACLQRAAGICAILAALGALAPAAAQKATERYIPIGRSPGVSHKLTVIGPIEAADPARRTITLAGPSGAVVAEVGDDTRIWLDRTKSGQANLVGTFADLAPGRTAEVRFAGSPRTGAAAWIKVEAPARR